MKRKNRSVPEIRLTETPDGRTVVRASRDFLTRLVREELLRALYEADEEEGPELDDSSKSPDRKTAKIDPATASGMKGGKDPIIPDDIPDDPDSDDRDEVPDKEDPADDEIESDVEREDDGDDERVSNELIGKTIQSITMEPKSKIVPGAQEVVLTFNETTDPLRMIITKTGEVRFFFRGGLHNMV